MPPVPDPNKPDNEANPIQAVTAAMLPPAWQPLSPGGVAAFSGTRLRRVFGVQLIMATMVAAVFAWFLHYACLPVVLKAVDQLPDQGVITSQQLYTPLTNTVILVEEPVLGFAVDLPRMPEVPMQSDVTVRFLQREYLVCSPLGCLVVRYPNSWTIQFNRNGLRPPIEAWSPFVLAGVAVVLVLFLMLSWAVLATVYVPIPMMAARYSDRTLGFRASWKLSAAAQMPGALLLALGGLAYGRGWIDLVQFLVLVMVQMAIGWFYLVLAPTALPRQEDVETVANPFTPKPDPESEAMPPHAASRNPFATHQTNVPDGEASNEEETGPRGPDDEVLDDEDVRVKSE